MADMKLAFDILARDKASKTLSDVGGNADKTGKKFVGLGNAAKAGAAVGAAALVAFAKGAISAASDVNESQSKVNTVFGASSKVIDDFAATASTKLGQSKGAVLEAAGTFGNLFVALGLSQKASAGLSTSAVQLATDLGSFNNASAPEALEAIKSGLLGEAEPLKRFGVNLSAARINAEAFAIGLAKPVKNAAAITAANNKITVATQKLAEAQKKHGKGSIEAKVAQDALTKANGALEKAMQGVTPELTAAQKAQAAYSVILKDTKVAQGDFARTSSGMANQTKIAQARFDDLQATVGAKLLPVVNKLMTAGLATVDWMQKNQAILKPLVLVIGTAAATYFLVNKAMAAGMAIKGAYLALTGAQTAATAGATGAQVGLNTALIANPIGLVVVAIAALAAGLIYAYKHSETFRNVVKGAFDVISTAASFMWNNVLKPTFKFIVDAFLTVAGSIVHSAASAFGWIPGIGGKLKTAAQEFDKFKSEVNNALDGIHKTIKVTAVLTGYTNPQNLNIGHQYATGGRTQSGLALVGERGPEIVSFAGGEHVSTAAQTRSMLSGGVGSGGGDVYEIHLHGVTDSASAAREIETMLTRLQRDRGTSLSFQAKSA